MTQYDNTNRGALFKNDRKEKDSHPDYKGSIDVGGEQFWLSAWIKRSERGTYMSLSLQPKDEQKEQPRAATQGRRQSREDLDDGADVPF